MIHRTQQCPLVNTSRSMHSNYTVRDILTTTLCTRYRSCGGGDRGGGGSGCGGGCGGGGSGSGSDGGSGCGGGCGGSGSGVCGSSGGRGSSSSDGSSGSGGGGSGGSYIRRWWNVISFPIKREQFQF